MAQGDVYRQKWHYYQQRRPVFGADSPGPDDLPSPLVRGEAAPWIRGEPSQTYYQQKRAFADTNAAVATMDPPQRFPFENLRRIPPDQPWNQRRPTDNAILGPLLQFDPTLAGLGTQFQVMKNNRQPPTRHYWSQVRPIIDQSFQGVVMDPPQRFPFEALDRIPARQPWVQVRARYGADAPGPDDLVLELIREIPVLARRTPSSAYYQQIRWLADQSVAAAPDLELELTQHVPTLVRRVPSFAYYQQYVQRLPQLDLEPELIQHVSVVVRRDRSNVFWQQERPVVDQSTQAALDLELELTKAPPNNARYWRPPSFRYWSQMRARADQSVIPGINLDPPRREPREALFRPPSGLYWRQRRAQFGSSPFTNPSGELTSSPTQGSLFSDPAFNPLTSEPTQNVLRSSPYQSPLWSEGAT